MLLKVWSYNGKGTAAQRLLPDRPRDCRYRSSLARCCRLSERRYNCQHTESPSQSASGWSARWRWPSGIAVGANEPIANQSPAVANSIGWRRQVVDISPNAYPGTIGKWCGFIEGGRELTGSVSDEEPDKEIRRRYHRRRNGSGYKCVRARRRDHSVSLANTTASVGEPSPFGSLHNTAV